MTDPKEKPRPGLRTPKPKKLGLSVPHPLRLPHEDLIRRELSTPAPDAPAASTPATSTPVADAGVESAAVPDAPASTATARAASPSLPSTPVTRQQSAPAQSARLQTIPLPPNPRDALTGKWTKMPNALYEGALKNLNPVAQIIYGRYIRETIGKNRQTCKIGTLTLVEDLGFSPRGVKQAIIELVDAGLLERGETDGSHPDRHERGTEYRVFLPAGTPIQTAEAADAGAASARMKEEESEKEEKEPLSDPARVREARRRELLKLRPGATAREIEDALDRWPD